ncbi:MAG: AAA family ATPase, partial [bacterium]|nr:AAA family ATPase [Candidatus Colisoma equi]
MNKIDNPFTPGAGFLPPELAGREQVIEDGRVVAARTRLLRAERGLMLIGSRGVGKTSLLKWLAEDARQSGIIPVIVEIQNDSQGIEELSAKMREALHTLDYVSKVKSGVRESFAVLGNFIRKFAVNVGSVGVEIETCAGMGESGNLESDLSDVLLAAARAAKEAGTAIGLYVDELQNMQLTTLSGVIVSLHHAAQELLPLYLIGSGL